LTPTICNVVPTSESWPKVEFWALYHERKSLLLIQKFKLLPKSVNSLKHTAPFKIITPSYILRYS